VAGDALIEQHLTDSKDRVIARTKDGGKVVLIEDDRGNPAALPDRRLMIFDARDRCIATIEYGNFSLLCDALAQPFDRSAGPSLIYISADNGMIGGRPVSRYVDRGEPFTDMDQRDRAICAALLRVALDKLGD
jgi:hypothetical protein